MAIARFAPGPARPTPRPIPLLTVALAVLAAWACERGGSSAPEAGVVRSDSAGIEIVVNRAPEHGPGRFWTVDPEPEIVIGGQGDPNGGGGDSGPLVWQVAGLARLADGRVAVLSGGNRQLALFDASGRLIRTIGRSGRGPGEFSRPDHLQYIPPDTLAVWDSWFGPVSFFDPEGRLLLRRTFDLGRITEGTGANAESPRVPLPDGSFVALVAEEDPTFQPAPGSIFRLPAADAFRVDAEYEAFAMGAWEGHEMWFPEAGIPSFPYYYLVDSHIAGGGEPLAIYASNGDRDEIRQFAPDGRLLRIIRRTTEPVPVTDGSREGWLGVVPADRGPKTLEAMAGRAFYPPVGALVVDAEGHLWVREWSHSESGMPDQWSVFGPDGRWLGVIPDAPPDFNPCTRLGTPCWIGSEFLLTVRRDVMGVERVEGYRIRREVAASGDPAQLADPAAASGDQPAPTPADPVPGEVFQDCEECPSMVVVPAGKFMMGTPDSLGYNQYDPDRPSHEVTIAAPFAVGRYEVTFAEWDACVVAGGCNGYSPDDEGWGRGRRPVINVSWRDAQAYVTWLGERTGRRYRLLSEAQWEYVARGGTTGVRYWGDDTFDGDAALGFCEYANGYDLSAAAFARARYYLPVDCDDGYPNTAPVGSFEPNAFGLYDVLGNVMEMTEDCSHENYRGAPTDGSPWVTGSDACRNGRVARGGSWGHAASISRATHRLRTQVGNRDKWAQGFRVAGGIVR